MAEAEGRRSASTEGGGAAHLGSAALLEGDEVAAGEGSLQRKGVTDGCKCSVAQRE